MWSILGRIFATPNAIEKTMDAVIASGDKIFYTKEEKAENQQKLDEWFLRYLEATQPQALSRRLLAISIAFIWVILVLVAVGFGIFDDRGEGTTSAYIFTLMNDVVNQPFTAIVIFYFGGHYLKEVLGARSK